MANVKTGDAELATVSASPVSTNGTSVEPGGLEFDCMIGGKAVHLKRRVPLKDGHNLINLLQACGSNDFYDQVAIMRLMIESWEFPGDPSAVESYEALDIYDEIMPMASFVVQHVQQRTARISTKN